MTKMTFNPRLAVFTIAMIRAAAIVVLACAALPSFAQATRPADPPTTQPDRADELSQEDRIDALISLIENSEDLVFIRNDDEHTAQEAADHLRRKLDFAGDRVETAEQFIEHIASGSSTTGRPYQIRLPDGETVNSGPFLRELLAKIEYEHATDNPAGEAFDLIGSDLAAIKLADRVMQKLGGRDAWDDTRYISFRFFGRRLHVWDRDTGRIRFEATSDDGAEVVALATIKGDTITGRVWQGGEEITDEAKRDEMLNNTRAAWINDFYWLIMPCKLKDSGVTLEYIGEDTMQDGNAAEVVQLTFDTVGMTPNNRYRVFIAKDSGLVEQWQFFREASQDEPDFTTPWANWKKYGDILLSDDRGEMRGNAIRHTDIAVFDELPDEIFTDPNADLSIDD